VGQDGKPAVCAVVRPFYYGMWTDNLADAVTILVTHPLRRGIVVKFLKRIDDVNYSEGE
jgi:hypothetical protein